MTFVGRVLACFLLVLGAHLAAAPAARADAHWHEARLAGDDARIVVSSKGRADVERKLRVVVAAGILDTFSASGVPPEAELDPIVDISSEAGEALSGRAERDADRIRIVFEPAAGGGKAGAKGRGLRHGTYVFTLKYGMSLVDTGMLVKEGVFFLLRWQQPGAPEGRDNVRTVFDLPEGRVPPELLAGEAKESTALTTLRRSGGREELDILRAHVPRGELTSLGVRIDAKAFGPLIVTPASGAPEKREPLPPAPPARGASELLHVAVPMACFIAGFALVRRKKSALLLREGASGAGVVGLIPLPSSWMPFVAGALAAAMAITIDVGSGLACAACSAAFAVVVTHRVRPGRKAAPVRRGRWVAIRPAEAFALEPSHPGDLLDGSQRRGVVAFVVVVLAWLGATVALSRLAPSIGYRLPITLFALLPLWFTGVAAQFPPSWHAVAEGLRPLFRALEARGARAVPWALVDAAGDVIELRLRVIPRDALPGAHSIEVAYASPLESVKYTLLPSLVLRVDDGSYAHAKALAMQSSADSLPGRKDGERVLLVPLAAAPVSELVTRVIETIELLSDRRAVKDRVQGARPGDERALDRRLTAKARVARMLSELPAGPIFG